MRKAGRLLKAGLGIGLSKAECEDDSELERCGIRWREAQPFRMRGLAGSRRPRDWGCNRPITPRAGQEMRTGNKAMKLGGNGPRSLTFPNPKIDRWRRGHAPVIPARCCGRHLVAAAVSLGAFTCWRWVQLVGSGTGTLWR